MPFLTNAAAEELLENHPTVDERRALIERIARSVHFRRSARLRDFLLYVGTESLKERHAEIHEQEIGAKVFGRDAAYDRSQDNIVRVNASELRKRIELYFQTEGASETLILDIPRGAYRPVFHRRVAEVRFPEVRFPEAPPPEARFPEVRSPEVRENEFQNIPAEPTAPAPPAAEVPHKHPRVHYVWAMICAVLTIACLLLFQQNRALRKLPNTLDGRPAVAALWKDFLNSHTETDIVLPDASISLIEDIVRQPISLRQYLNHTFMTEFQSLDMSSDRKADLDRIAVHNLVTFGDVRAAQQILALTPGASSLHLTLSRYFTADAIKSNNIVLIGGKKANPWIRLFDDNMNFSLDYDIAHSQAFVANRHPQPGEPSAYLAQMDPNALVGYSVVAYVPNPSRTGAAIIIAGTDSDASSAAAEFLTSEEQLEKFRKTLPLGKFPYFEMVLKTSRLSGTSFNAEVLAYRTYPDLH